MLQFLANNGGTILVSVLLAVIVVAVARYMIRQKKQGNSSCGCGCEHCSSHWGPGNVNFFSDRDGKEILNFQGRRRIINCIL